MCKGDINRHQPKTAKIDLGLNHHVLNSRTALTRRAILNTCKMWCFLLTHVVLLSNRFTKVIERHAIACIGDLIYQLPL